MQALKFRKGELVWAKATDEPIWPAEVTEVIGNNLYTVSFFNDSQISFMRAVHLSNYFENRAENARSQNTEKFKEAVRLADLKVQAPNQSRFRSKKPKGQPQKKARPDTENKGKSRRKEEFNENLKRIRVVEVEDDDDQSKEGRKQLKRSGSNQDSGKTVGSKSLSLLSEHIEVKNIQRKLTLLQKVSCGSDEARKPMLEDMQKLRLQFESLIVKLLVAREQENISNLRRVFGDNRISQSLEIIQKELDKIGSGEEIGYPASPQRANRRLENEEEEEILVKIEEGAICGAEVINKLNKPLTETTCLHDSQ